MKSKYIIKRIFQNLNEKEKLLLIRYNKFYKKLLGIDIEHYKKISGKIKIGESNGYCKVYDIDSLSLKFEGFYKNGKKNGEGKEYIYDRLRFEGEYKNGKRNGKGIEYNHDGKLVFEGEYIDGKKWKGKIKEYDNSSEDLIFEGEYLNGKKIGKEYDQVGKIKFEGEYLDEKRWNGVIYNANNNSLFRIKNGNGKVEEYNENGELLFEGEYLNGKRWNGKLKKYSDIVMVCRSRGGCRCCRNMFFEKNGINEKVKEYKNILRIFKRKEKWERQRI